MYYFADPTPAGTIYVPKIIEILPGLKNVPEYSEGDIPAWSLEGLLNIIRTRKGVSITLKDDVYTISVYFKDKECQSYFSGEDLFEAAMKVVIFMLDNKLV